MNEIFYNNIILIPAITFVITVFLKGLILYLKSERINIFEAVGSGGMPSIHSALVVSLTTALYIKYSMNSEFFAISIVFTIIIIYDALNIRYQAGLHASEINRIIGEKKYNESLGHLPSEAFAGIILGMLIAMILLLNHI